MADAKPTFKFFHYDPSLAAAVVFTVLFLATTGVHGYQMLKRRAWLLIPFFIGGCCEWTYYEVQRS